MSEQSLGHLDTEPEPVAPRLEEQARPLTVLEVLARVELPQRTARVCLKPSLLDKLDENTRQLQRITDAQGQVLDDDPDRSMADESNASKAQRLQNERLEIQAEIDANTWAVRFQGKSSEDMAEFNKLHDVKPDKDGNRDMREYNTLLMAECAIEPELTVGDINALRKKLGTRPIADMVRAVQAACAGGGIDAGESRP